jgi:hypothetical protein
MELAFEEAAARSSRAADGIACRIRSMGKLVTPGANPPQLCVASAGI